MSYNDPIAQMEVDGIVSYRYRSLNDRGCYAREMIEIIDPGDFHTRYDPETGTCECLPETPYAHHLFHEYTGGKGRVYASSWSELMKIPQSELMNNRWALEALVNDL